MYQYVVVSSGSYEDADGCWVFPTFKDAFNFLKDQYNQEYFIWQKLNKHFQSTTSRELTEDDYEKYVMSHEVDDGTLYVESLLFTIHDQCNEKGVYSEGMQWELYTANVINSYPS